MVAIWCSKFLRNACRCICDGLSCRTIAEKKQERRIPSFRYPSPRAQQFSTGDVEKDAVANLDFDPAGGAQNTIKEAAVTQEAADI